MKDIPENNFQSMIEKFPVPYQLLDAQGIIIHVNQAWLDVLGYNREEAFDFIFCTNKYADRDCDSHPNVILLDLKLPKVDGLEVLRRIKADPKTKHIPVVMLTSSSEESDIVESYKLGVNGYIVKPVDFKQFTESIRQIGMYWLLMNKRLIK